MEEIGKQILNLLTLTNVSTIIGILGGLLGALTFIDNYLLKFNPIFVFGNKVFLSFKKDKRFFPKNDLYLDSIICKIDIHNKRNKIGNINDLALRIYNCDSTNPHDSNYFAFYELINFPESKNEIAQIKKSVFSSLSVLAKSKSAFSLEFSVKDNPHILDPSRDIIIELYYKEHDAKWIKVDGLCLFPYDKSPTELNEKIIYDFSILNWDISRNKLKKSLSRPESRLYKGITDKYLKYWLLKPYYLLIKRPFYIIINLLKTIYLLIEIFVKYIWDNIIILPIVLYKSKTVERIRFTSGKPELVEPTDKAIQKMVKIFEYFSEKINSKTKIDKAKLIVTTKNGDIRILRDKQSLKLYKSGDGHIVVHDEIGFNHRLIYYLELHKFVFGIKIWKMNKKKYYTLKSVCVKILDAFVLHSAY